MSNSSFIFGIHHAALNVRNLDEAQARWSHVLGLQGERHGNEAVLRCAHEDMALRLIPADAAGLSYVAYELAPGVKLVDAADRLSGLGVAYSGIALPSRGPALHTHDAQGNGLVLVERLRQIDARPAEVKYSSATPGFHPRKLGHVNYLTANARQTVDWYASVLGFHVTDWIAEEGCWMHVNPDHHVLALVQKGVDHVHHLAFELVDWGEMRVAFDHLAQNGRPLVWGPGRHGIARNLFSYFRMQEEDLFVELFADLEQLPIDHEPRIYPDDTHTSNTWGRLPPRTYFRFDAEAIELERLGAQEMAPAPVL